MTTAAPKTLTRPRRTLPQTPQRANTQRNRPVSVRGRLIPKQKADPHKVRFTVLVTMLLFVGVLSAVALSMHATTQAYQIDQLRKTDRMLGYQLETLNRDIENMRSGSELARQAAHMGMVVPDQPGVLAVEADGNVATIREADPEKTRPIVDINGTTVRPNVATSNPAETDAVRGVLDAAPQVAQVAPNDVVPLAPYQPRRTGVN